MKRTEMLTKLKNFLTKEIVANNGVIRPTESAEALLTALEASGMRPPRLDEDRCQALTSVYMAGYTMNQWEEDFEKDSYAVEAYNRRMARKKAK